MFNVFIVIKALSLWTKRFKKKFWRKVQEISCVDTPQQNENVERDNCHLLNVPHALRFQASLPINYGVNVFCVLLTLSIKHLQSFLIQKLLMRCCFESACIMLIVKYLGVFIMLMPKIELRISSKHGLPNACF